jgi:acyl-CoA oxidase
VRAMPPEVGALLREPLFAPRTRYHLPVDQYMLTTIERARAVYDRDLAANDMWCGGRRAREFPDFVRRMGWFGAFDLSLLTAVVSHQLAGNALLTHASPAQEEAYAKEVNTFSTVYAFAASEVGRGSDLRRVGTEAHYVHTSRSLMLVTPRGDTAKCWINNTLHSASVAMVLARLIVDGTDEGHHWIRVPLRAAAGGALYPEVCVQRADPKGGIAATQTGIVSFAGHQVPVDQLMSGWARIDDEGCYESDITRPQRYTRCLDTFVQERLFPVTGAAHALRRAAAIALRYSTHRRTYRKMLIEHSHYQERLVPVIARARALDAGLDFLVEECAQRYDCPPVPRQRGYLYAMTSAFKATTSWQANQSLAELRELCGGHGFHSYNEIVALRNDYEVNTTFAGDNTILCFESIRNAARTGVPDLGRGGDSVAERAREVLWQAAAHWLDRWRSTGEPALARPFAEALCAAVVLNHWQPDGPVEEQLRSLYGVDSLLGLLPRLQAAGLPGVPDATQLLAERARHSTAVGHQPQALLEVLAVPRELLDVPLAHPDYAARTLALAEPVDASG